MADRMKLGMLLPLGDIGGDPGTVKDFAQAAEALGYDDLAAPDHVLGVNAETRPDWARATRRATCSTIRSCCSVISAGSLSRSASRRRC